MVENAIIGTAEIGPEPGIDARDDDITVLYGDAPGIVDEVPRRGF